MAQITACLGRTEGRAGDMKTECPNCGHPSDDLWGYVFTSGNLLGCSTTCTKCGEEYTEWFKATDVKHIGSTINDCVATVPCTFFYPAEGETEQSMKDAGVQDVYPFKKGG